MKNTKNAWKLLFTMLKQNRLIWVSAILIIMGILMLVLVGVEGVMMGDEEHLLSASFTGFGSSAGAAASSSALRSFSCF